MCLETERAETDPIRRTEGMCMVQGIKKTGRIIKTWKEVVSSNMLR